MSPIESSRRSPRSSVTVNLVTAQQLSSNGIQVVEVRYVSSPDIPERLMQVVALLLQADLEPAETTSQGNCTADGPQ